MTQHPFAIEFHYTNEGANQAYIAEPKYHAVITTLSKSLGLFKVTGIRKIDGQQMTELNDCYYLTSYPLDEEKDERWKDAVTKTTDDFLQAIGKAIEKHIYTSTEIAPYLN